MDLLEWWLIDTQQYISVTPVDNQPMIPMAKWRVLQNMLGGLVLRYEKTDTPQLQTHSWYESYMYKWARGLFWLKR